MHLQEMDLTFNPDFGSLEEDRAGMFIRSFGRSLPSDNVATYIQWRRMMVHVILQDWNHATEDGMCEIDNIVRFADTITISLG